MEQIKILFFALTTFFGIEGGLIAPEKTTVTIHPENKTIEVTQNNFFTITNSENEKTLVLKQWDKLYHWEKKQITWVKELDNFPTKRLSFTTENKKIQAHLKLNYANEKALKIMGIWYNKEKNEFSINHIPQHNIKTEFGKLEDNYLVFNGNNTFSFTIEPFLQMPEQYKKLKQPLEILLAENKKE